MSTTGHSASTTTPVVPPASAESTTSAAPPVEPAVTVESTPASPAVGTQSDPAIASDSGTGATGMSSEAPMVEEAMPEPAAVTTSPGIAERAQAAPMP